jgi:hypothetical protein
MLARAWGVCLLTLAVLAVAPAWGRELIPMPPLGTSERGAYRARDVGSGAELWESRWLVTRNGAPDRPIVEVSQEGRRLGESVVPPAWMVRMRLDLWGPEPRLSSTRQGLDAEGRALQVEHRVFDYRAGTGTILTKDAGNGRAETRTVRLTSRSITGELLAAALRLLPASPDRKLRLEIVTRGGSVIGTEARVAGRESVEVPAGTFDCYKIELVPTGFIGFLADVVLPRVHMWQTVAAPHFWVKYHGPESGIGSRFIVRELLSFGLDDQ